MAVLSKCQKISHDLGMLPQYIIYFFNKLPIRKKVIDDAISKYNKKRKFVYFGTWYLHGHKNKLKFRKPYDKVLQNVFSQSLNSTKTFLSFIKENKEKFKIKKKILFSIAYCYSEYSIHFISFIFDPERKKLIHFDPGVRLYKEGQDILVPSVINVFKKTNLIKSHIELGKTCTKYIYNLKKEQIGIQFNGKSRDAYCQSWTLCFLIHEIKHYDESMETFCRLKPVNRKLYLYKDFIIPFLEKNRKYMQTILKMLVSDGYNAEKPLTYLKLLKNQVKTCKKSTWKV